VISVVVPTEELRNRLRAKLGDAHVRVWRPGALELFLGPTDLLVLPYMLPAPELHRLEGLPIRIIQSQMLGYDSVAEHLPAGIVYCNAIDVHEGSTAELALTLVLSMLRGIPKAVRDGDHSRWDHERHHGLAGRRVVVLGAGGVGGEIIRRLAPFGATVDVVARSMRQGVHGPDSLAGLLPRADVVILAIPLTDRTRALVDADFIAAMKSGALLVNVSRGGIVDTDALVEALREGRIRAALDVTDPEPLPTGHPLWSLPGVLITPHLGGDTDEMDARIDRLIAEQVRRLARGEQPANIVAGV
jgi:phosphoglycerate dehydrogenase-like enzyme